MMQQALCRTVARPAASRRWMTSITDQLTHAMETIHTEGRYRTYSDIERRTGQFPSGKLHGLSFPGRQVMTKQQWPKDIVSFCSNDYLDMGQHPLVLSAMQDCLQRNGAGSGGTRNISGTSPQHTRLEQKLALLHEQECALLFSSCFVANDTTLATLGQMLPGCVIFSDEQNHASLITGIRSSKCRKHIFRNNDMEHLEELLAMHAHSVPKLIVFESVYSMSGAIAPIAQVVELAAKYGALTFLDEVHAVGLYGGHGGGLAQQESVQTQVDIISGTLSKGIGVFGGYIAASTLVCDYIRSHAPGFIFTTSLPPHVAAGAHASITHLYNSTLERTKMFNRSRYLRYQLLRRGVPTMCNNSHIIACILGEAAHIKQLCDMLLFQYGFYVQPINYPTVPTGTERLRITVGPNHTYAVLDEFADALASVYSRVYGRALEV